MAAGSVEISVTPDIALYYTAQEIRITLTVRDINGAVSDPGNLSLRIRRPDDTEVVYTYGLGQLTKLSTGVYYYDLLIDVSYDWVFRGEASGGVDAAYERKLYTEGSVFAVSVPMPVPGSGHEGEIARVTGGVYQPYAGTPGKVLGWVAGQGWVAVTVAGLPGAAAPPVSSLQYNNAGAFGGAANILVGGTESQLRFFGAAGTGIPANDTTSFFAVPHGFNIMTARNGANTLNGALMSYGLAGTDILAFGDTGGVASMVFASKAGGFYDFNVAGTVRARWGALAGNFSLDNITFGGLAVASGAWLRFPNNTNGFSFRDSTGLLELTGLGAGPTDIFTFGNSNVNGWQFFSKAATAYEYRIGGTLEYSFGATVADWKNNDLSNVNLLTIIAGGAIAYGGTPATAGFNRYGHNTGSVAVGRNNANTQNVPLVRWGAFVTDMLYFGSSSSDAGKVASMRWGVDTGGTFVWEVNGASVGQLDATALTLNSRNLVQSSGFIQQGTNPASAGTIRWQNIASLQARNYDNSGNVNVIGMSGDGSTFTDMTVGDASAKGNNALYLSAKAFVAITAGAAMRFSLDAGKIFLLNTTAAPGDPVGGGHIYEEAGALKHRGSSGTITMMAAA